MSFRTNRQVTGIWREVSSISKNSYEHHIFHPLMLLRIIEISHSTRSLNPGFTLYIIGLLGYGNRSSNLLLILARPNPPDLLTAFTAGFEFMHLKKAQYGEHRRTNLNRIILPNHYCVLQHFRQMK